MLFIGGGYILKTERGKVVTKVKRLISLICCGLLLIAPAGCSGSEEPPLTGTDPTGTAASAVPSADPTETGGSLSSDPTETEAPTEPTASPSARPTAPAAEQRERQERLLSGIQAALLRILPPTWEELRWNDDWLTAPENRAIFAWYLTRSDPLCLKDQNYLEWDRQDYAAWYRQLFGEEGDAALLCSLDLGLELAGDSIKRVDTTTEYGVHYTVTDCVLAPADRDGPCSLTLTLTAGLTPYVDPRGRHYLTARSFDFPANPAEFRAVFSLERRGSEYRADSLTLTLSREPERSFAAPADPRELTRYGNRALGESLAYAMEYALPFLPREGGDFLASREGRAAFAWGWLEHAGAVPRVYDRQATGDMEAAAADYQMVYRTLFGEEGDPADLSALGFRVAEGRIFGSHPTGGYTEAAAKFVSFTEGEGGEYLLTADLLKNYDEEGWDESVEGYAPPEVTDYPDSAVSCRVTAVMGREGDRYYFTSLRRDPAE